MRNKLICLLSILCIFSLTATAEDINSGSDWGAFHSVENAWDGQKIIKNADYDAIVDELEKRKNSKKIRAQKRAGDSLMKDSEGGDSIQGNNVGAVPEIVALPPVAGEKQDEIANHTYDHKNLTKISESERTSQVA